MALLIPTAACHSHGNDMIHIEPLTTQSSICSQNIDLDFVQWITVEMSHCIDLRNKRDVFALVMSGEC